MDYYEFRRGLQTCAHCQWHGPGKDTRLLEAFTDLAEYACPRCGEKIAVVMYPTIAESRANWNDLDRTDQAYVGLVESRRREFAARSLRTPDQLPDIHADAFVLLWDDDGSDKSGGDTVVRFADRVIWREPSVYEGYWRFDEIAKILRTRYGAALQDLEPTRRSELYLYGDKLSAPGSVVATRNALRALASAALPPIG